MDTVIPTTLKESEKKDPPPTIFGDDAIETRTFSIVNKDGTESGTYRGTNPRNAALKAARKLTGTKEKPVEFKLRELGDHTKLHVFSGYTALIKAPEPRPVWIKKDMITKAFVKKIRVEKIVVTKEAK